MTRHARISSSHSGLRVLKYATVALAVALVVGESYRSWDVGRPFMAVADDWLGAALLLWAAHLTTRPGHRPRRIVIAIWGVICGFALSNFSFKLLMPDRMTPGNLHPVVLQAAVGAAFVVALVALVAAVLLPVPDDSPAGAD